MKKILVPTDFSGYANDALAVAAGIGLKTGAELFLLHLEYVMNPVPASGSTDDEHIRTSRNRLFRLADETERLGLKVHTIFVEDQGFDSIEDYIRPYGIDFIVMGSHGQSGIKDYLIGSKTMHLVRKTTVPVLVIKSLISVNMNFPEILFASDFRSDLTVPIAKLASIAAIFNSEVRFLFLNLFYHLIEEDEARRLMDGYASAFKTRKPAVSIAETNDVYTGVKEYLNIAPAGLIAVCLDHSTLPGRLLNPPLAEKLISSSKIPVLVLPLRPI